MIDTKVNNASFLESVLCFDGNLKWSLGKQVYQFVKKQELQERRNVTEVNFIRK